MVREICGVQLKDSKRSADSAFILSLNETIDQLAMVGNVHCYGRVLRGEDCDFFRKALDYEVVGQRMKWRPKRTWKNRLWKKV